MKAEWIWVDRSTTPDDSYAEFKTNFARHGGNALLRVSADSIYAAFLNGECVLFSQCADFPHYKLYDEIDLTDKLKNENELYIIVWYHGETTQIYLRDTPGLWFELTENGTPITASSAATLSRVPENYREGYCKQITHQMGYSFYYDNTVTTAAPYRPSVAVDKLTPIKRPQQPLYLDGRVAASYTYFDDHILVDLGKEVAGYLELDFDSGEEQELLITYGEHLETGKVSRLIDGRDFSLEFKARRGENKWFIPLRRLAGRYIELYHASPLLLRYVGIRHVYYPVTELNKKCPDPVLQKIYETSVRTLRLCMHEHYEDCPWREQALYALDSRNQMLFGYHAFGELEYPRSNLLLINQSPRPDGMLPICIPAGSRVPIPLFSLAYVLEVAEYIKYSGEVAFIETTKKTVEGIISAFNSRISASGLIPEFEAPFWNFYEWSEGNDGNLSGVGKVEYVEDFSLILNAFYVYTVNLYNSIAGTSYDTEGVKEAIKRELYDAERGLYRISKNGKLFGQLGNALAALAGLDTPELLEKIAHDKSLTQATLSMKPFVYDALLKYREKYEDYIINDIREVYTKMLDAGATSFWETELGWVDFGLAGSLCHGWSASPVYYLDILGKTVKN